MNNEIKKLVITSMFLGMCGVLSLIQIPLPFIASYASFDLAVIPLLLSRRFIGLTNTLIISLIYPFFTLLSILPNFIGVIFLIFQSLSLVFIDYIFNKNKYSLFGVIISIVIVTLISTLINVFLIMPLYVGGFSLYWSNPMPNVLAAIESSLTITPIRLIVGYVILWPLWILLIKNLKNTM